MNDKIYIRYFTASGEFANRIRNFVPIIGDEIRFKGVIYIIKKRVWIEDELPERVHIFIEKCEENE